MSAILYVESFLAESSAFSSSWEKKEYDNTRSKVDDMISNIDFKIVEEMAERNYDEMSSNKMEIIYEGKCEEETLSISDNNKGNNKGKDKSSYNKPNTKNQPKEKKDKDPIDDLIRCFTTQLTFKNAIDAKKPLGKVQDKGNKAQLPKQDYPKQKNSLRTLQQEEADTENLMDSLSKLSFYEKHITNNSENIQTTNNPLKSKVKGEQVQVANDHDPLSISTQQRDKYSRTVPLPTITKEYIDNNHPISFDIKQEPNANTEWLNMCQDSQVDGSNFQTYTDTYREYNYEPMDVCSNDKMEEVEEYFSPIETVDYIVYEQPFDSQTKPILDVVNFPADTNHNTNDPVSSDSSQHIITNENISLSTENCTTNNLEPIQLYINEDFQDQTPAESASSAQPADINLSYWSLEKSYEQYGDKVDHSFFTKEFYEKNIEFFSNQRQQQSLSVLYDENNKITSYTVQLQTLEVQGTVNANEYDPSELVVLDLLTKFSNVDKKQIDWNNPNEIPKIKYSNFQLPPSDLSINYLTCTNCKTKPQYNKIVTICQSANLGDFRGLEELEILEQENIDKNAKKSSRKSLDGEAEDVKRLKRMISKRKTKLTPKPRKHRKTSKTNNEDESIKKTKINPEKRKDNIPIPLVDLNRIYKQLERDYKRELLLRNIRNSPKDKLDAKKSAHFVKSYDTCALVIRTEEETIALLTDTTKESTIQSTQPNTEPTASFDDLREQSTDLIKEDTVLATPSVDTSTLKSTYLIKEATILVIQSVDDSREQLKGVEGISGSPLANIAKELNESLLYQGSKIASTPTSADSMNDSLMPTIGIMKESLMSTTHGRSNSTIYLNDEPSTASDINYAPQSTIDKESNRVSACQVKKPLRGKIKGRTKSINKRNPCEKCGKILTTPRGLKYHLEKVHTAEKDTIAKPFVCPIESCIKKYKSKNGLRYHLNKNHPIN